MHYLLERFHRTQFFEIGCEFVFCFSIQLDVAEEIIPEGIILFDLPPVLVADDVISFLPHLDCILLVIAAGQTTAADLATCERLFGSVEGKINGKTEVLGIVLNKSEEVGESGNYY